MGLVLYSGELLYAAHAPRICPVGMRPRTGSVLPPGVCALRMRIQMLQASLEVSYAHACKQRALNQLREHNPGERDSFLLLSEAPTRTGPLSALIPLRSSRTSNNIGATSDLQFGQLIFCPVATEADYSAWAPGCWVPLLKAAVLPSSWALAW
ncbi:hypothetical protein NDU88_007566 [Pleurodeles waltl]|uniref:Uncharacterized protein n=1 Tax=Pleurodeles waltl TaxID=8319 RepID=A0AAV7WJR7_PLEWA|nr:hypothetical protein NDU88_007566 [Pleurodeles waltl]